MKKSFAANWRFAVVTYGEKVSIEASFTQFPNITDFEKALHIIEKDKDGMTEVRLDEALDLATTDVFSKARPGTTKLTVVLTDGSPIDGSNTLEVKRAFEASREAGVRVITLGIGKGLDAKKWSSIDQQSQNLIQLKDSHEMTFKFRDTAATLCAAAGKNIPIC